MWEWRFQRNCNRSNATHSINNCMDRDKLIESNILSFILFYYILLYLRMKLKFATAARDKNKNNCSCNWIFLISHILRYQISQNIRFSYLDEFMLLKIRHILCTHEESYDTGRWYSDQMIKYEVYRLVGCHDTTWYDILPFNHSIDSALWRELTFWW